MPNDGNLTKDLCLPAAPQNTIAGRLFIVSAPSGAGKTTLCRKVMAQNRDILYSVSYTTRHPRLGEVDGADYHFVSVDAFKEGIRNGDWAEWALVHGNYYATSARFIESAIKTGQDVLLDIDVQGAAQIVRRFPESVTIFVMPPNMEELKRRLEKRNTDDPGTVSRRLAAAMTEMAERHRYRYIIVNDDLSDAIRQLSDIVSRKAKGCMLDAK